jgi:hypothetical protein
MSLDFLSRINAVLHSGEPDRVPFAPYDNLVPRGAFERELRNRGMGLCVRVSTLWSEMPHVRTERYTEGESLVTVYHTPAGHVSTRTRGHTGRISDGLSVETEGMIKSVEDFEPVILMLDDTVFHRDDSIYHNAVRDVGADGIVRDTGLDMEAPPYGATRVYFGSFFGLDKWVYAQHDYPGHFARLVEAQARRDERRLEMIAASPAEFIAFGWFEGLWGAEEFKKHELPFYRKWVPYLQSKGKICALHCDATRNLKILAPLIGETGSAVIEAFTPPPVGEMPVKEVRAIWGPDTVIWVNIPETVFWFGRDYTREWVEDLLRSDPPGNRLVLSFTEMGLWGAAEDETERMFKAGTAAVMDAIEASGQYPIGVER